MSFFINDEEVMLHEKKFYLREKESKGIVILAVGKGDRCSRFIELIDFLNFKKFSVYSFDWKGCGQSKGEMQIDDFKKYAMDLKQILTQRIYEGNKDMYDQPIFILSHGLGCLSVAQLEILEGLSTVNPHFQGVVLSSPMLTSNKVYSKFKLSRKKNNSRSFPNRKVHHKFDVNNFCRDSHVVDSLKKDKLIENNKKVKAKWEYAMLNGFNDLEKNLDKIKFPFLYLHSKNDKICLFEPNEKIVEEMKNAELVRKVVYDELYHDLFHEPEKEEVFKEVVDFFNSRLAIIEKKKNVLSPLLKIAFVGC